MKQGEPHGVPVADDRGGACVPCALTRSRGSGTDRPLGGATRAGRPHAKGSVPVLLDLIKVLDEGPDEVRTVTLDRGDYQRYRTR